VGLLETIGGPADVKRLRPDQLDLLAAEIRDFLVQAVSKTGGHLGPNLGAVELSIALHRVFDSPHDSIIWDTGHQAYVHKLLTGRASGFDRLRQSGGLSGYPSRAESEHDLIENSHASTALSYADGLAKARRLRGESDRHVVAVVGDGALTGGMAWEALNNIADADRPVIIVVNDNERSYAPTIGGLSKHLAVLRTMPNYERFLRWGGKRVRRTPVVGGSLFNALHGLKKGIKDAVAPQGLFEDLGLKYVGPIDGHDIEAVSAALVRARDFGEPVIVHCLTRKGEGYAPAENDDADHFHGIGICDPATGLPLNPSGKTWTSVFAEEMVRVGAERPDVVAITAAMLIPVGLKAFAATYPDRVFDVGIAEQHAVTSAAGLAMGGMHPVVAVYATFLNRAFDQVLLDASLHATPVTFVLDRAGITGEDGASHHGVWDLSMLMPVPGLRIAAPRDPAQLKLQLSEALMVEDGPTVVRFPKGAALPDIAAIERVGDVDVLARRGPAGDVLLVSVGALAPTCLDVADRLADQGIGVTVVDPRWVKPVDPAIVEFAGTHRMVVTVEDGVRIGGVGSAVTQALQDAGVDVPVRVFGTPVEFLEHGSRSELLARLGLGPQDISRGIVEAIARLDAATDPAEQTS
jgi:1-deoxy-D-xylulose-5-phosphate synthase